MTGSAWDKLPALRQQEMGTMAARTRSKAKEEAFDAPEAPGKPAAKKARAAAKSVAPVRKAAAKKAPGAKKTAAAAKPKGKTRPAEKTSSGAAGKATGDEQQMLVEQNEALRAELEAAKARIEQLEKVHGDVLDRIDWVIDSLQTALEDKA